MKAENIIAAILIIVVVVVGGLPLLAMFTESLVVESEFSLYNYSKLFTSPNEILLLRNSFVLALVVAIISVSFGVLLGLALGKTNIPFRNVLTVILILPLLLPPFFNAFGWFYVFGRDGIVAQLLGTQVSSITSRFLFGFWGCALVLSTAFAPIPMLLTMSYIRYIPKTLEEAARLSSSWSSVLRNITLPMIRSGIVLSMVLVFLLTLGEVSVPLFLRFPVYAVQSLTEFAAFYDFGAATAAAVPLSLIALILLFAEGIYFKKKSYLADQAEAPMRIILNQKSKIVVFAFTLACTVCVILPLCMLIVHSGNYSTALQKLSGTVGRTFLCAAISATILTFIGFLSAFLARQKHLLSKWFNGIWLFLFALPGPVLGIALITLWNRPNTSFVYGSSVILILGFLAQYLLLPSRIMQIVLYTIPSSFEEAGRISGARWFPRIISITLPLSVSGLAAAWLVGFLFCVRDTGMSLLIYPPGKELISARIFTLMANTPLELIAACLTILMILVFIPMMMIVYFLKRRLPFA